MSTLLEPGECVRWQHGGGWKVGRVLYSWRQRVSGNNCMFIVQCPEGVYIVSKRDIELQPMRAEWEGKE